MQVSLTLRRHTKHLILAMLATIAAIASPPPACAEPPRLLVLTDIGGDPDDQQSMRRLMLYANEFRIEGLIASASGTPGEVGAEVVRPDLITDIVNDYETARGNLALNAAGFPTADALRGVIKSGNPKRGVSNVGAEKSTQGSNHIIASVDASREKLHVSIWGGATDLAQALYDVNNDTARTQAQKEAFHSKLRVYAITDQDKIGTAQGTGDYIRANFPDVRYIESGPRFIDGVANNSFAAAFRGMYQNDSSNNGNANQGKVQLVPTAVVPLNQKAWVDTNVRNGHGPLGAGYPLVTQNPTTSRNTSGVKEGDTPSWFYLLPNGLSDPDEPTWGGWGGRFDPKGGEYFIDAEDDHFSGTSNVAARRKWTVARWREAYQNDFAARMDWAAGLPNANHNPLAVLNGDTTQDILTITANVGDTVDLLATGSSDPDGDDLISHWWVYQEAGTYSGPLTINNPDTVSASLIIPDDAADTQIHVVLEIIDNDPLVPLTSYRRLVIHATTAIPEPASAGLLGLGVTLLLGVCRRTPPLW